MIDASYNSTTSITTFEVTAFDGKDAAAIARAVLKVSDELVNELSTKARLQLISNAQGEVKRTEDRLAVARQAVAAFRDREQTANPTMIAESDQAILQSIETTLIELKSRRASLLSTVDLTSPSVRVLDRQIASYAAELEQKRRGIGSGGQGNGDDRTLTTQLTEYNALSLEQEFAEKAYTSALASLETSQAEARKQERYFAIAVEPDIPEIALYPLRVINVIIAFFVLCVVWLIGYLVVQAVRDHTV
jgi:capsular polysaccharide transport system permease protein